jgi:hypothetical protein
LIIGGAVAEAAEVTDLPEEALGALGLPDLAGGVGSGWSAGGGVVVDMAVVVWGFVGGWVTVSFCLI